MEFKSGRSGQRLLCYRHERVPHEVCVVEPLPEGDDIDVTGDDTGGVLWPAAVHLASWLVEEYSGKSSSLRIIELGCGVGFSGIVAAHLDSVASVMLTDQNLGFARANVELIEKDDVRSKISVNQLMWGDEEEVKKCKGDVGAFDIVIASDILYGQESHVLQSLAWTMKALLVADAQAPRPSDSARKNVAFVILEMRNYWFETHEWIASCEALGFEIDCKTAGPQKDDPDSDAPEWYLYILRI